MANNFCCCFIILKIVDFRWIIKYFGTLRMHQIAPFLNVCLLSYQNKVIDTINFIKIFSK